MKYVGKALLYLAVIVVGAIIITMMGLHTENMSVVDNPVNNHFMDQVYTKVIQDSIDRYNIVKGHDDKVQQCVYAGIVMSAYLQYKDESNYVRWKTIQDHDCK